MVVQDPLEEIKGQIEAGKAASRPAVLNLSDQIHDGAVTRDRQFRGLLGFGDIRDQLEGMSRQGPDQPAPEPLLLSEGERWARDLGLSDIERDEAQQMDYARFVGRTTIGALGGLPFGAGGAAMGAAMPTLERLISKRAREPMSPDAAFTDILTAGAAAAGGIGGVALAGKAFEALKIGKAGIEGAQTFEAFRKASRNAALARDIVTGTAFGVGGGAAGGGTFAALTGRPVPKTALYDAAYSGAAMALTGGVIRLGYAGLGLATRLARVAKTGVFGEGPLLPQYRALETSMADLRANPGAMNIPEGYEFSLLTPDQLKQARTLALRMGLPVQRYAEFLDDIAEQNVEWPRSFFHTLDNAVYNMGEKLGRTPAVPYWASELPDPLKVPEKVYAFKTSEKIAGALGPWVRKVGDFFGVAPGEANRAARSYLQEYAGTRRYWTDLAKRDVLTNYDRLPDAERGRLDELLHGYIEVTPEGARARSLSPAEDPAAVAEREARYADMPPGEARSRELARIGAQIEPEGRLTLTAAKAAIEGDPLLTRVGKDTGLLIRRVTNEMEGLVAEHPEMGHVWSRGLYFKRAWILKEAMDALEKQDFERFSAAMMDPAAIATRGVARAKRDRAILEVDQMQGGAWWIRNTKTGKLTGDTFTDPVTAGKFVSDAKEAGKSYRVEDPITWREANEGTTKAGKLILTDIAPHSVKLAELGNDLAVTKLMNDISANPLLTADSAGTVPRGWLQMPSDDDAVKRFGPLAGKIVRKNIGEHLLDIATNNSPFWDKLFRGWVFGRLAASPGTQFRNQYWNLALNDHPAMALPPYRALPWNAMGAELYATQDPLFRFAVRKGMIGGEFTTTVNQIWKEKLEGLANGGEKNGFAWWNAVKQDLAGSGRTYASEDQISALGGWLKLMMQDGLTPLSAMDRVKEVYADFRLMRKNWPSFEVGGMTVGGAKIGGGPFQNPFVKFDVEQLRVFNNAMKYGAAGPLWLAKWYAFYPAVMTAAALKATGMTWDEFVDLQRRKPMYRTGDLASILLPIAGRDEKGRFKGATVDIGNNLPFMGTRGDVRLETMFDQEDMNWASRLGWATAARLFSNPLTTALLGGIGGINIFTGQSVAQPGESQAWARPRALMQGLVPLPQTFPPLYFEKKFREAASGVPAGGRVTHPQTVTDAVGRLFGFKYQEVDPEAEKQTIASQTNSQFRTLHEEMRAIQVRHVHGQLSEPEYNRAMWFVLTKMANVEEKQKHGQPSTQVEILRPFLGTATKEK